jgi:lipopolysaccharide transport system permease protein
MTGSEVTVYSPDSSQASPLGMAREFRDLLASRELAWRLAVRDIRSQYRQTAGVLSLGDR